MASVDYDTTHVINKCLKKNHNSCIRWTQLLENIYFDWKHSRVAFSDAHAHLKWSVLYWIYTAFAWEMWCWNGDRFWTNGLESIPYSLVTCIIGSLFRAFTALCEKNSLSMPVLRVALCCLKYCLEWCAIRSLKTSCLSVKILCT